MSKKIPLSCEHVESNGVWFVKIDGKYIRCVSCGKPVEHVKRSHRLFADHHCDIRHVSAVEGANTRLQEPIERDKPWGQRLSEGFELMND